MSDNYFVFHCHTDYSNLNTTMDSVTKVEHYIDKVKEEGMGGICFSEHGNLHDWVDKKLKVEEAGLKYVHGVEAYVTKSLDERVRDNYHVVLIAKNYEGVEEINYLMSDKVANNRDDGHFYYTPRITFDELINTSENVITTSACLGNILNSDDVELQKEYIKFMAKNKDRCFLEIQHHNVDDQKAHNKKLLEISKKTGVRLIAGTDTHNLNEEYEKGREVLQKSKFIHFDNEDGWDLNFKNRQELEDAYEQQGILDKEVYMEAIDNTNVLFDMVKEFELDYSYKYPELYDNSEEVFKKKIAESIVEKGIELTDEVSDRVNEEFETIKKNHAIDYMLLEEDYKSYCRENGIPYGYGRGCFTKDAIVVTSETMKPINEVEVGDRVVSDDGKLHKVLNTFEYDIEEDLIEFRYFFQDDYISENKNLCTTDHKVLVKRGKKLKYMEAEDLEVGDFLCSPKMKEEKFFNYSKNKSLNNERYYSDKDYWYLPISEVIRHDSVKTKVYDLHVEDNHSYMINNIIVHNSVTGSYLAYLLDITAMDSIKHDLNFSRFMNEERVSLCD